MASLMHFKKAEKLFRHWPLLVAVAFLLVLTLPRLENNPPVNVDDAYQMGPADGIATRGIWGSPPLGGPASLWRDSRPDERMYLHPPLYFLSVAASLWIFGWGVIQARAVSVLFGAASIIAVYALGLSISRRRTVAFASAVLLASQPVMVHISRQTRPEPAMTFFTLLGVLLFVRYSQGTRNAWAFFTGLALGAAAMSHYNGAFGIVAVAFLFLRDEVHCSSGTGQQPLLRRLAATIRQFVRNIVRSKRIYLYCLGVFAACLPYGVFVLGDYKDHFYHFFTQLTVVGRADAYKSFWEQFSSESERYAVFFHDYRFLPGTAACLKVLYGVVLIYALLRRTRPLRTLLIVFTVPLLFLAYPSANKTPVYFGALLPYLMVMLTLLLAEVYDAVKKRIPQARIVYLAAAAALVLALVCSNLYVWRAYYKKYESCDFMATVEQLRQIIPKDATSVMGRYDFWIGLKDYNYYRRGFRTFEDIALLKPEIIIHNDISILSPDNAQLKQQLDTYLAKHGVVIGRVKGHPKQFCLCGDLVVYRVSWDE